MAIACLLGKVPEFEASQQPKKALVFMGTIFPSAKKC